MANELELLEAWGDTVDRTEYLYDDSPPWFSADGYGWSTTSLSDRKDGSFRPVYETEVDLAAQRAVARALGSITRIHDGAIDSLANYTFAGGFDFVVTAKSRDIDQQAAGLIRKLQEVVDGFVETAKLSGDLDREIHHRSRIDGECLVKLRTDSRGQIRPQIIESEQLTEPLNAGEIEEYEGLCQSIDDAALNWKFGVATERDDSSCVVGFHVLTGDTAHDWEFLPEAKAEFFKRNTTRNAKRGVSDLYGIFSELKNEARLSRNAVLGASVQAAIAWIRQHPPGVTSAQATSLGGTAAVGVTNLPRKTGGTQQRNALKYQAGSILDVPNGLEYKPGPLGAERNAGFDLIGQRALRRIGQRWNMPESMISGDASNANYASSLVAEAPFVKARQADQVWYGTRFVSMLWKVIGMHWRAGAFERFGVSMEQLRRFIDIVVNYPTVESRDPLKIAQTAQVLDGLGVISPATIATQQGLDYEEELRQGAKKPAPPPSPFGMPGALGGGAPGSGDPMDDQSPLEPAMESLEEAERWITIGGDEDGGGTHIKIDGEGNIVIGPKAVKDWASKKKAMGHDGESKGGGDDGGGDAKPPEDRQPQPHAPKRNPKLTIRQADAKLRKVGYQIEGGEEYDMKNKQARYRVKQPDGKTTVMTSGDIFGLIAGAGEKIGNAVNSAVEKSIGATRKIDPSDTASQIPKNPSKEAKASVTSSPAFQKWFSGSKVVDDKGRPLAVYHGTNADFDEFDIGKSAATDIKGVFFGTSEKLAGSFGSKNIIKAHVNIKNPATFADVQRIAKSGVKIPQLHKALQKEGFDGIYDKSRGLVVAFDPRQIKSVDNAGTFDPNSNKFRESTALQSAISAALESVTTSAEARAILEQLTEQETGESAHG